MHFEEHKIALLPNPIAETNTCFRSQDIHFSGAGQIFTLAMSYPCIIQQGTGTSILGKPKHLLRARHPQNPLLSIDRNKLLN